MVGIVLTEENSFLKDIMVAPSLCNKLHASLIVVNIALSV